LEKLRHWTNPPVSGFLIGSVGGLLEQPPALLYEVEALGGGDGIFVGEPVIVFSRLNNSVSPRSGDSPYMRPVALSASIVWTPLDVLKSARAIRVVYSLICIGLLCDSGFIHR
jgi:hypothetical protein